MLNPYAGACELRELVLRKEIRPREVAEFFLARIERLNPRLGAFMTVTADRALDDAARLEDASESDRAAMPLFGVAYSLKDLTWTRGIRTTLGSKNFENYVPRADQEYAARLAAAGGILLGKTTTPEFGGRPTTEGGLCPPAHNPWNLEYTAGGSSGGAATAVASGLGPIAEGSDGGGSIRIPAACCGLVGIKPARARVSNAPVMGEGWGGFATNGPLARSVLDAALMLDVMAGPADGDPYWASPPPCRFADAVKLRPRKLRLAAISATAISTVDPEILAAFESACDVFRAMGHAVEPIGLDPAKPLLEIAQKLICAGISSIPLKDPSAVDPVVRSFWERGRAISASEYIGTVARISSAGWPSPFPSMRPASPRSRYPTALPNRACRSAFRSSAAPPTKPGSSQSPRPSRKPARGTTNTRLLNKIRLDSFLRPRRSWRVRTRPGERVSRFRGAPQAPCSTGSPSHAESA
jgi:amidase